MALAADGDATYLQLAQRWSKGAAILFAVGAVSGTVLSFELGLLWPHFMQFAGPIIGMPFSLEGFAFFTEAIFLGVYLYGWDRISPRAHIVAGLIVAISGAASAVFVTMVNAWMNTPTGLTTQGSTIVRASIRSPECSIRRRCTKRYTCCSRRTRRRGSRWRGYTPACCCAGETSHSFRSIAPR